MRTVCFIAGFSALAGIAVRLAPAAAPIPAERQVKVRLVASLSAPADSTMHMPTDVVVTSSGIAYVADGANDRIVRFHADGRFDRAFVEVGGEHVAQPLGLFMDAQDRLWIADTGNSRLLVRQESGELHQTIPLPPSQEKSFDPTDLVVTADGQRTYIVDNENHRVAIRDNTTGEFKFLGRFGEGLGQFRWPFMVCIAPDGYVYVSEAIGARVQRLTPEDRWAGQVGRWGVELGQLYRPKGVAFSPRGHLLVGDSTMEVVQIFSPRGALEGILTDEAGKPLRFEHAMGMTFDAKGRLYVTELQADRIAVVELPPEWTGESPSTRPEGSE